jgi:hypothetical protein
MYLRAGDTISGQEGKATATINGSVVDMFYLKDLEATLEKNKAEIKTLGKRGVQSKAAGWKGTGSMTLYYVTTAFRKLAVQYAKTGVDTNFTITIVNDDPGSTVGKQTVVLYNCNLDSVILAKLDVETESLDESIDFTFDDVDILDEFGTPVV